MQYDEHLRKQLRGTAPPGSQKFILIGDCEGPSCRRWPTDGFFPLWDDNPVDVPDGLYLISFFSVSGGKLATHGPKYIRVKRAEAETQKSENHDRSTTTLVTTSDHGRGVIVPEHHLELSQVELNLRAATAEFQKHKMAVAMQRDAIGLARASRHTQELQEQAQLNQTYRLEMQAMAETHSNITRRHVEHSAKMIEVLGTTSQMVGRVVHNLQETVGKIALPPPPPVDYSETIVKSIGMLGGLALQFAAVLKGKDLPKTAEEPAKPDEPTDGEVEAHIEDDDEPSAPPPNRSKPDRSSTQSRGVAVHSNQARPAKPGPSPVTPASQPASKPTDSQKKPPLTPVAKTPVKSAPAVAVAPREAAPVPEALAGDDEELDRLVDELAGHDGEEERALPVAEKPAASQTGPEFFLAVENEDKHEQFRELLNKCKTRGELEQLVALNAPHLLNRPD